MQAVRQLGGSMAWAQVLAGGDGRRRGLHRAHRHRFRAARRSPGARLRAAMETYQAGAWPQAYAQLSALADAGDPSAARVAAMMARQGPLLFGQRFDVSPERLARWELAMRNVTGAAATAILTSRGIGGRTAGSPRAVQVAREV